MVEKFTDADGTVWFKNDFLSEFKKEYISVRMIVSACRCCHVPLSALTRKLPIEICKAVEAEEERMFNTLKMPLGKANIRDSWGR
jgi:hypothetical protein